MIGSPSGRGFLAAVCLPGVLALAAIMVANVAASAEVLSMSYRCDQMGRLVEVGYGNGTRIFYVYDANGNLLRRLIVAPRVQPRLRPLSAEVTPEAPPTSATSTGPVAANPTGQSSEAERASPGSASRDASAGHVCPLDPANVAQASHSRDGRR